MSVHGTIDSLNTMMIEITLKRTEVEFLINDLGSKVKKLGSKYERTIRYKFQHCDNPKQISIFVIATGKFYHNNRILEMVFEVVATVKTYRNEKITCTQMAIYNCECDHEDARNGAASEENYIYSQPMENIDIITRLSDHYQKIIVNTRVSKYPSEWDWNIMKTYCLAFRSRGSCSSHGSASSTIDIKIKLKDKRFTLTTLAIPETITVGDFFRQVRTVVENIPEMVDDLELHRGRSILTGGPEDKDWLEYTFSIYALREYVLADVRSGELVCLVQMQVGYDVEEIHGKFVNEIKKLSWHSSIEQKFSVIGRNEKIVIHQEHQHVFGNAKTKLEQMIANIFKNSNQEMKWV